MSRSIATVNVNPARSRTIVSQQQDILGWIFWATMVLAYNLHVKWPIKYSYLLARWCTVKIAKGCIACRAKVKARRMMQILPAETLPVRETAEAQTAPNADLDEAGDPWLTSVRTVAAKIYTEQYKNCLMRFFHYQDGATFRSIWTSATDSESQKVLRKRHELAPMFGETMNVIIAETKLEIDQRLAAQLA